MRKIGEESADCGRQYESAAVTERKPLWIWIAIAACAAVAVFALWQILSITSEDSANRKTYRQLAQTAKITANGEAQPIRVSGEVSGGVDFDALKQSNEEIIGWIEIPGTDISYPVLQHEDNDFYITHNALGEENRGGAIFLDTVNVPELTDLSSIIYGHNMKDGSMFAHLHQYEDAAFLKQNDEIVLHMPTGEKRFRIFAAHNVGDQDDIYFNPPKTQEALQQYCEQAKQDPTQQLPQIDKLLTLSTCIQNQGEKRFIVQAYEEPVE